MTTLGPEGVRYSEKFGILKLVLFLWAASTIVMRFMFHNDILGYFIIMILGVRYTEHSL